MLAPALSSENRSRTKWNIDRKGNREIARTCINVFTNKHYGNVTENIINSSTSSYTSPDSETPHNDRYHEEDTGIVAEDRAIGILGHECKKLVKRDKYGQRWKGNDAPAYGLLMGICSEHCRYVRDFHGGVEEHMLLWISTIQMSYSAVSHCSSHEICSDVLRKIMPISCIKVVMVSNCVESDILQQLTHISALSLVLRLTLHLRYVVLDEVLKGSESLVVHQLGRGEKNQEDQ